MGLKRLLFIGTRRLKVNLKTDFKYGDQRFSSERTDALAGADFSWDSLTGVNSMMNELKRPLVGVTFIN